MTLLRPLLASTLLAALASSGASAQSDRVAPGQGGRFELQALEHVATIDLPELNFDELMKEDVELRALGQAPRFAVPRERRMTPRDSGTWEDLSADTLLWRLRVRSPGALSLNLGFTRFDLPEHARLHLYSADRVHVVRPFTHSDVDAHGELWTPVVLSDDIVLELSIPE